MNLPTNGKVIVVDDTLTEAIPLINVLSKEGVAVQYFDGELDNLPDKPIYGTRLVFLDIELGTGGQDNKSKAAKVISVLSRVVGTAPNPYVIIAWTKHVEVVEIIKQGLGAMSPILFLTMEKYECKDAEGNFSFQLIKQSIEEELKTFGCFHLFLSWENTAANAASETVNNAFSFFPLDQDWDNKMQNVIYNLAKAYSGKQLSDDIVLSSLITFNSVFADTLEKDIRSNISNFTTIGELRFEDKRRLDKTIMAKINSNILLSAVNDKVIVPGNLYSVTSSPINLEEMFESTPAQQVDNIYIEVSPTCDYAQQKWRLARILPGVLISKSDLGRLKNTDYLINTPLLFLKDRECHIVCDLRLLDSVKFEELEGLPLISRLRHMLLVDVQSYISKHISRPGYLSLA